LSGTIVLKIPYESKSFHAARAALQEPLPVETYEARQEILSRIQEWTGVTIALRGRGVYPAADGLDAERPPTHPPMASRCSSRAGGRQRWTLRAAPGSAGLFSVAYGRLCATRHPPRKTRI